MNKSREEIHADGSRWIGDGPTYIVIFEDGGAGLMTQGKAAEHRALIKNFTKEVTSGGVTLTVDELLFIRDDGVPAYSESLATLVRSIIRETNSEEEADALLKQLRSIVIAARRLANEPLGKTDHERFRVTVIHLAKQLGRAPTRNEIRRAMFLNAPTNKFSKNAREITRLCRENGLSWLTIGKSGRPKKEKPL